MMSNRPPHPLLLTEFQQRVLEAHLRILRCSTAEAAAVTLSELEKLLGAHAVLRACAEDQAALESIEAALIEYSAEYATGIPALTQFRILRAHLEPELGAAG